MSIRTVTSLSLGEKRGKCLKKSLKLLTSKRVVYPLQCYCILAVFLGSYCTMQHSMG